MPVFLWDFIIIKSHKKTSYNKHVLICNFLFICWDYFRMGFRQERFFTDKIKKILCSFSHLSNQATGTSRSPDISNLISPSSS